MNKEFLEIEVDNFDKLCHKAKEIILDGLINQNDKLIKFIKKVGILDWSHDSPIEQILFFSLIIVGNNEYNFGIQVRLQKEIEYNGHTYKGDICVENITFNENNSVCKLTHSIIIECDGYNYHSSKEQMQYDYNRENNLKLAGYDIIRFTGSQIYNSPLQCAKTVYDYIKNKISNGEYKEI
jgi:hypothetical protein